MRHLRRDYDAIQPWPAKRPHIARLGGQVVTIDHGAPTPTGLAPLIPADEPVFLLRGQDPIAAHVVHYWADRLQAGGGDPTMVAAVRAWADEMAAYAKAKGHGLPDVPPGMLRDPGEEQP